MSDSEVISVSSKKAKKCSFYFTKDSFSMYDVWLKDFFFIHNTIYEFIGDNLENFYKIFLAESSKEFIKIYGYC